MRSYNGFSGEEREAKLRALKQARRDGALPAPPAACMLCGDPDVPLEPHSEDYSRPYRWTPPAMYWLCTHCHKHKLHKRFARPDVWRVFLAHVRRGGYARDLKDPQVADEFRTTVKAVASGAAPVLARLREVDPERSAWAERLTVEEGDSASDVSAAATGAERKPTLYLIPGEPTVEDLIRLYRQLTGKEPTPEEVAFARTKFESRARERVEEETADEGAGDRTRPT